MKNDEDSQIKGIIMRNDFLFAKLSAEMRKIADYAAKLAELAEANVQNRSTDIKDPLTGETMLKKQQKDKIIKFTGC